MKKLLIFSHPGLAGCATSKAQTGMAIYDFGALRLTAESAYSGETTAKRLGTSLLVTDVAAPIWLDSNAIQYHLAYHDPARIYAYGANRWAASPSILSTAAHQESNRNSYRRRSGKHRGRRANRLRIACRAPGIYADI